MGNGRLLNNRKSGQWQLFDNGDAMLIFLAGPENRLVQVAA
jgi:hypothetical protein